MARKTLIGPAPSRKLRALSEQLEPLNRDVKALDVWHMRSGGMSLTEIQEETHYHHHTVIDLLRHATELIKAQYLVDVETKFEQAQAQIDLVLAAAAERVRLSKRPTLDWDPLLEDLESGAITPEAISRYVSPKGIIRRGNIGRDWDANDPRLDVFRPYLIPGEVSLGALEQFRKASESKRKLLGLDKDKQRIEIGTNVTVQDVASEIAEIAAKRRGMLEDGNG